MPHEDPKTRSTLISCAGALISLALHILLIAPVVMGFGGTTRKPPIYSSEMESLADAEAGASSVTTLTLIDEPDPGVNVQGALASAHLAVSVLLISVSVPVPSPKFTLPADDDTDTPLATQSGSGQPDPGRQLLFGRYVGQITARIERAWMRPRTPIDSAYFACRVHVTQDRHGVVEEVELVRCNGDPRWQTSLVRAIQSASPLPAPPDADVFTDRLTLDLQSATFTPGAPAEEFEPAPRQ